MKRLENINKVKIYDVATVHSERGRAFSMENRVCFGLSFCKSGQITYTQNGKEYVSEKHKAILLPRGAYYNLYCDKTGDFPLINFDFEGVEIKEIITLDISNTEKYFEAFDEIKELSFFATDKLKMYSRFFRMLDRLLMEANSSQNIVGNVVAYIEENYYNPELNNTILAAKANISEVYMRRLFVKEYKTTPKQYITDIRIRKAEQLLSEGVLTVGETAIKCGFRDIHHFSRVFKIINAISPLEYRRENSKNTI